MTAVEARERWVEVCDARQLTPDRGVAARVGNDVVAVFLLADGTAFAVEERDPFTGTHVLSRGIVGDAGGTPTVASPLYKQRFDLRSGACLDDDAVAVRTWPVRIHEGRVEVALA